MFLFVVISQCYFSQTYFLVLFFDLSFTLLWTCCESIQHIIYRDRFSSIKLLFFVPPLLSPLFLKATRYADERLLMVFAVS